MSDSESKEDLMMGLNHKESLSEGEKNMGRSCSACKTTKTPLWRGGPAGPKSLCNACGIRFRKKRSPEVRVIRGGGSMKRKETTSNTAAATIVGGDSDGALSESIKLGLVAWSKKLVLKHRSSSPSSSSSWFSSPVKRQRSKRKLREEEEAAVLLMYLSCGSVFA